MLFILIADYLEALLCVLVRYFPSGVPPVQTQICGCSVLIPSSCNESQYFEIVLVATDKIFSLQK